MHLTVARKVLRANYDAIRSISVAFYSACEPESQSSQLQPDFGIGRPILRSRRATSSIPFSIPSARYLVQTLFEGLRERTRVWRTSVTCSIF